MFINSRQIIQTCIIEINYVLKICFIFNISVIPAFNLHFLNFSRLYTVFNLNFNKRPYSCLIQCLTSALLIKHWKLKFNLEYSTNSVVYFTCVRKGGFIAMAKIFWQKCHLTRNLYPSLME